MLQDIKIGRRTLGLGHKPMIVAELSGNHNGSLQRALDLVQEAAKAGADAVKLQTYTADSMTLDLKTGPYFINDPKSLWQGRSLYDLYQEAATPYEWHKPIFDKCRELGMECFSTPFDLEAVDFLLQFDVPCFKIASFEVIDLPLVRKVAATKKPLIISSGMATIAELHDAVNAAKEAGCKDIILLKCTSSYPASPLDSNIRTIANLRETFNVHAGLSDHTMGIGVPLASVAFGCVFVEKHFTMRRADGGVDSAFSLEPEELKLLTLESERAFQSLGKVTYERTESEKKSLQFRRTLIFKKDLKQGATVKKDDIAALRPGIGLSPKYLDEVIGSVLQQPVKKGDPVLWEIFHGR